MGFNAGEFRGAITRVPAVAGLWTRLLDRSFRLDASVAVTAALERYQGVSPHSPSDATRLAPGVELGVTASSGALAGLAPILRLTLAWIPVTGELAAELASSKPPWSVMEYTWSTLFSYIRTQAKVTRFRGARVSQVDSRPRQSAQKRR